MILHYEAASMEPFKHQLVVSIVSHGHAPMVLELLTDLAHECLANPLVGRVVVTLNIPEPSPPLVGWPYRLELIRNKKPRGFGANHNSALAAASEAYVCVLNPDVRLRSGVGVLGGLVNAATRDSVGLAYPIQIDESGAVQDFERALPTPWGLLLRHVSSPKLTRVEWVNAACLVARREVWMQLSGFDERYFMYCEDVDLSLRVRLAGLTLARVGAEVVHSGQRASRKSPRHLWWHIVSLFRLWGSPVFYRACRLLQPLPSDGTSIAPK